MWAVYVCVVYISICTFKCVQRPKKDVGQPAVSLIGLLPYVAKQAAGRLHNPPVSAPANSAGAAG